jgi:hypothetical protein
VGKKFSLKFKILFLAVGLVANFSSMGQTHNKMGEDALESIAYLKKNPQKMKLVKLIWNADLKNGQEIYNDLGLDKENTGKNDFMGFFKFVNGMNYKTKNPYYPRYIEHYEDLRKLKFPLPKNKMSYEHDEKKKTITYYNQYQITEWFSKTKADQSVCAVKFISDDEKSYRLKTFKNNEEAKREGYTITHKSKCGTCSSLKDLAVYIAKPDLTTPARSCATKSTLNRIKKCIINKIGFSEYCAETWAYSAYHTRFECIGMCIKDYGLLNIIFNNMEGSIMNKDGSLRPCVACDEYKSGPAFKYGVGRNRRRSGLKSRIIRKKEELYQIDHFKYFKATKNWKWYF